jgi:heme/copper-type cytochrome/quinol oxidase subunit 2
MLSVQTSHLSSVEATASRGARHGPAVGLQLVLMNPSGDVAIQQRNLILVSTGLMLLIIVPVR